MVGVGRRFRRSAELNLDLLCHLTLFLFGNSVPFAYRRIHYSLYETEDAILTALAPYLRGRTFIVVSHRISTLKNTDQIVVMDEGVVVQQGSHKELLAQTGFYSEIFRLQQLEESIRKEG